MKDTYTNGAYSVPISQASMKMPEDVALQYNKYSDDIMVSH